MTDHINLLEPENIHRPYATTRAWAWKRRSTDGVAPDTILEAERIEKPGRGHDGT